MKKIILLFIACIIFIKIDAQNSMGTNNTDSSRFLLGNFTGKKMWVLKDSTNHFGSWWSINIQHMRYTHLTSNYVKPKNSDSLNLFVLSTAAGYEQTIYIDSLTQFKNLRDSIKVRPTTAQTNNMIATFGSTYQPQWTSIQGRPADLSAFTNGPGYITGITQSMINSAQGYTAYNGATNILNFISANTLSIMQAGAVTVTKSGTNFTISAPSQTPAPAPTLSISGNTISTVGGNSISIPSQVTTNLSGTGSATVSGTFPNYTVSVTPFTQSVQPIPATTLAINGSSISTIGGNTITLPAAIIPSVAVTGNSVSIVNSNTVALPSHSLSVNGASLSIANGNTINLPFLPCDRGSNTFSGITLQTTYTVSHGLSYTPALIILQPRSNAASEKCFVVSINSTSFIVTFLTIPILGTNNIVMDWISFK